MTLLASLASEWRSVGSTRVGLAAHMLYCIAAELERDPRAIGLRVVEQALARNSRICAPQQSAVTADREGDA